MGQPLLATDGYKFSMAEAGWPLRQETFYASHRTGGLQVLPFDIASELARVLPEIEPADWVYLREHDYEMGAAYRAAMANRRELKVKALPRFAVFNAREPLFCVTGSSALVSWLEPLVLQWNYRIQVATEALLRPEGLATALATVTCEAQRAIVLETLDAVGVPPPPMVVDSEGYVRRVRDRVRALSDIVGDPQRLFEVGLRAATCVEQHLLALGACKAEGLLRTSHVHGARVLGMAPVGTMGHEHVQRYGSDEAAFRAMVERRHQRSSFLLDTYDTITSGIPAAYGIIRERPGQGDSIRYDSGDKEAQYRFAAAEARRLGIRPVQILEDGFDLEQTRRFEVLRLEVGWTPKEQVYGYGGFLVAQTSGSTLTRDRVSAVYKLSQTGPRPTMKFGNEVDAPGTAPKPLAAVSGKQSLPGVPVVFRRDSAGSGPFGLVGQDGEPPPRGYHLLTGAEALPEPRVSEALAVPVAERGLGLSPRTSALVASLRAQAKGPS
jgi:nicotinate phosphoribosyltransferase